MNHFYLCTPISIGNNFQVALNKGMCKWDIHCRLHRSCGHQPLCACSPTLHET